MRLRHLFSSLILGSVFLFPLSTDASGGHVEGKWSAHPPLHIQKQAQSSPTGYSPAQIRTAYGFDAISNKGAGQIIGIVDAYDAPTVAADLAVFIKQYQLQTMHGLTSGDPCTVKAGPHPCFQKVYAAGKKPKADAGWSLETSLDVEWSHVASPLSDIVLVESSSSSLTPLLTGVDVAVKKGAHVVSMSWGGPEFSTEMKYDAHFKKNGVSFLAASGDGGTGQSYPASSPYVLSVGGTTLSLDSTGKRTTTEKGWQGSGGGISTIEKEPGYQSTFGLYASVYREGPDVSLDADPATGYSVYDSTKYDRKSGWYAIGGTSAAAPQWAGIVALINEKRDSPLATNSASGSFVYSAAAVSGNFRDIRSGKNGTCGKECKAATGYDLVTGLGSPIVDKLVGFLQSH